MATRAEWTERVRRCERSGLDLAEFARREGIKLKQLYWWRWRLRSTGELAMTEAPEFLPVRVITTTPSRVTPIEIALPNGRIVRVEAGFDPAMLERVLAVASDLEVSC